MASTGEPLFSREEVLSGSSWPQEVNLYNRSIVKAIWWYACALKVDIWPLFQMNWLACMNSLNVAGVEFYSHLWFGCKSYFSTFIVPYYTHTDFSLVLKHRRTQNRTVILVLKLFAFVTPKTKKTRLRDNFWQPNRGLFTAIQQSHLFSQSQRTLPSIYHHTYSQFIPYIYLLCLRKRYFPPLQ